MKYPGATWYPSSIVHPSREATWGVVIHWTAGHEAGDLGALNGPDVDCQFYVTKKGKVYQFVQSGSQAWHAYRTANHYCIGIEHENLLGEPWTKAQFDASVKLSAWIVKKYQVPPVHTKPSKVSPPNGWHGFYGHKDLQGIDGNNHFDTIPAGTGWPKYMSAIRKAGRP